MQTRSRVAMNVGIPILDHLTAPPESPFSRSASPASDIQSPRHSRPGSPYANRPADVDFSVLDDRNMVEELTTNSRLAREAAFELLLARDPMQAAALDERNINSRTETADHRHNVHQRPVPRNPVPQSLSPERRLAPPSPVHKPRPRAIMGPSAIIDSQASDRDLQPRIRRPAPGGIWASNNRHLPYVQRPLSYHEVAPSEEYDSPVGGGGKASAESPDSGSQMIPKSAHPPGPGRARLQL